MEEWMLKASVSARLLFAWYVEPADNGDRLAHLLKTSSLFSPLEPALSQSPRVLVSVRLLLLCSDSLE